MKRPGLRQRQCEDKALPCDSLFRLRDLCHFPEPGTPAASHPLPFKVQASPVTAQSQFFTAFSSAAAHQGAEISGLTAPGPAGLAPVAWSGAELAVILPLGLSLALYLIGLARLWHRAGFGRGIRMIHVAAFAAGWLTLAWRSFRLCTAWARRCSLPT
jgi:hypothetical protein